MKPNEIYENVTNRITEALESGTVPWRKPFGRTSDGTFGPRNANSNRPYRGINRLLLALSPYESPYWATYKGIKKLGGQVRKGEKSTLVIFWKPVKVKDPTPDDPEHKKTILLLRYYNVFNVEQADGLDETKFGKSPELDEGFDPIEAAEKVVENMPKRPPIVTKDNVAAYDWLIDAVYMPPKKAFESPERYYAASFHELAHSTGHESRLGRVKDWARFGSEPYAQEELVAEMTAAFLVGSVGIDAETVFEQSAAYIQNWLAALRNDPKMVVFAAQQAQKAADFILGVKYEEPSEEVTE